MSEMRLTKTSRGPHGAAAELGWRKRDRSQRQSAAAVGEALEIGGTECGHALLHRLVSMRASFDVQMIREPLTPQTTVGSRLFFAEPVAIARTHNELSRGVLAEDQPAGQAEIHEHPGDRAAAVAITGWRAAAATKVTRRT